ncbi:hypothetical protein ACQJBY_026925 [Aegilops geniculata]
MQNNGGGTQQAGEKEGSGAAAGPSRRGRRRDPAWRREVPPPPLSSRKRGSRPMTWWCSTWCCGATWRMRGRLGAWWRRGDMPPWPPSGRTATTRTQGLFELLPHSSCLQFSPPNLRICVAPLIKEVCIAPPLENRVTIICITALRFFGRSLLAG